MRNENWNYVVRRVRNKPLFLKGDGVSSAFYKDSKGVSVSKDCDRGRESIIEDEERIHQLFHPEGAEIDNTYKLIGIVSIDKLNIESNNVEIVDQPEEYNPFHAVLCRNQNTIRLSSAQAKALARQSVFIKRY